MEIKSTTRYARFSPKKGRDVAREIVGLPVSDAIDTLTYTPKKAAFLINKTLKTAVADAENNFDLDPDTLIVTEASVTAGPAFRRFKPRARGSAAAIKKRTSHISVTVAQGEVPESSKGRSKAKKAVAPQTQTTNTTTSEQAPVEFKAEAPTVDEKRGLVYASAPAEVDDLKKISGVGPVLEQKLNEFGIYKYSQIEAWSEENISEFDDLLSFKGRIDRDNWLEQAKTLNEENNGK